jgi:hypothetical protein
LIWSPSITDTLAASSGCKPDPRTWREYQSAVFPA